MDKIKRVGHQIKLIFMTFSFPAKLSLDRPLKMDS